MRTLADVAQRQRERNKKKETERERELDRRRLLSREILLPEPQQQRGFVLFFGIFQMLHARLCVCVRVRNSTFYYYLLLRGTIINALAVIMLRARWCCLLPAAFSLAPPGALASGRGIMVGTVARCVRFVRS